MTAGLARGAQPFEAAVGRSPEGSTQATAFDVTRLAPYRKTLERMLDPSSQTALLAMLGELEQAAPDCLPPVLRQLEFLLAKVGVRGLYGWALAGLRAHAGERAARLRYFDCDDALSVQILNWEAAGRQLPSAPAAWQAYLFGLSGLTLEVGARRQGHLNGPPARSVLTRTALALPDSYTFLDGPERGRVLRAATAHAAAHLLFSPAAQPAGTLKPLALTLISLLEDARVEALLARRYPGLQTLWRGLHGASPGLGLSCAALLARLSRALVDTHYEDDNFWVNKGRRLFEGQHARLEDAAAFRGIASILANDLGQMRVQFDLPGYAAAPAYRDDHSYLWDYAGEASGQAALEQSIALESLPGTSTGHSVYEAAAHATPAASAWPAIPAALAPEASTWDASRIIRYPEWDERIETFRQNWCTLLEKSASEADSATAQVHVGRSRSWTGGRARELDRAIRLRRQRQGERFDFDALIDAMASRRQGGHIDERVFECPGTRAREAAILMLLDVSASSAQPLAGQAVTVLETEKALALRAVALAQQGAHRIAVHGFASNTRNEVRYERYVDFGVALGPAQRQRLANATAGWSTRFGAALRHACALVGAQPVRDRIILMVTDGAPADIDVTRDAYLVEDARMAVQQARRAGIRCFCLALDAQADAYVRRIFGVRNYLISVDADFLQQRLKSVLATLVQP